MNSTTRIIDLSVEQLEALIQRSIRKSESFLREINSQKKEFYSPKEFAHLTGLKYSTVVYRCVAGRLKARQDNPNCVWQIFASELDRYRNEATDNHLND